MPDSLISDNASLHALCARLRTASWVALDTEFMRVQTYRARLCLVQLATPDEIACVDPLADLDLAPLLELLYAPAPLKVLHAARQDLEVFADIRGAAPEPVFDTQIAAALSGYDDQIGYGALVERITGTVISKAEARTDWAARPLSPAQVRYAEDDVRHLREVYRVLDTRMHELGRMTWLQEECAALGEPALYRNDPQDAWRRLGAGAHLSPVQQTALVALAAWRERAAQERNLPRGWVVTDPVLVDIARHQPTTQAELAQIADLKPAIVRRDGEALLEVLERARQTPARICWDAPERLDTQQTARLKRLTNLARERAAALQISAALLAPRRELLRLLRGDTGCALLRGWRYGVVGEELLALRDTD